MTIQQLKRFVNVASLAFVFLVVVAIGGYAQTDNANLFSQTITSEDNGLSVSTPNEADPYSQQPLEGTWNAVITTDMVLSTDGYGNAVWLPPTAAAPISWLVPAVSLSQRDAGEGQSGAKPVVNCGPKWLGGCFQFSQRSFRDTFTDCKFWCFTLALTAGTAVDYSVTRVGLDKGKCRESNSNIGQDPSAGTFAKDFAETHLPVIVLGFFIQKTVPRHPTTKVQKVASWIFPAMASYGAAMHLNGASSWLKDSCW